MFKKISVWCLVLAAVSLLLAACGGGNASVDRMFAHYDAMIKILRDNKSDPDKAFKALNDYQEANKVEMDQLDNEITEFTKKNPLQAAGYLTKVADKAAELAKLTAELTANIKIDDNQ
ncbi:MAG: hypothetical protein JXD23_07205 [Spirochaetales bacterium]|nr:hypothetical protein [Spirochaetales bacterium]